MDKKNLPDKRKVTVLVIMVFLLLISLLPYFFYYVPANEQRLKQYGFLKLNRARTNIIQRDADLSKYYETSVSKDIIHLHKADLLTPQKENRIPKKDSAGQVQLCFYQNNSGAWSLLYFKTLSPIDRQQDLRMTGDSIALVSFVQPCLEPAKELFESMILIHYSDTTARIVYQDIQNGVEQNIKLDSLVPRTNGMRSPNMVDISLRGIDYKMFTCPFPMNNHQLILCGFLKSSDYQSRLHQMPVAIVYTIIIIFLLFLVSLPLFKIFMMNEYERIQSRDLVHICLFIFGGCSFITIVIIQVLLLMGGNKRIQDNLQNMSRQLSDSLATELQLANQQLHFFDSTLASAVIEKRTSVKGQEGYAKWPEKFIPVRIGNSRPDAPFQLHENSFLPYDSFSAYHHFDRASWIDRQGYQVAKIELDRAPFLQVNDRRYFRFFSNRVNALSSIPIDSLMVVDPLYSWANKQFRINLCIKSQVPGIFVTTMATRLYSLMNTTMPPGYGFCIIDERGEVGIHSDSVKSLRENFLDEAENLDWIKRAISSRQADSSNGVFFYGKTNTLRIQPLHQLPLYLVSFYDEAFLSPFNIRILLFSIFAWAISTIFFLLMWLLWRSFRKAPARSMLFGSMDYWNLILPRQERGYIYQRGFFFIAGYILLFLLLMLGHVLSELTVLAMILLHPLILVAGINFISRKGVPVAPVKRYVRWFVLMVTAASLLLAVLPPSVYTWFAHNQEFIQSVKKEQLNLAYSLQRREKYIRGFVAKNGHTRKNYLNWVQYTEGIYTINHDSISCAADCSSVASRPDSLVVDGGAESLYLNIINAMGFNFDDPARSPALKARSTDNLWRWQRESRWIYFDYGRPEWRIPALKDSLSNVNIQIMSRIPPRFIFLSGGWNLFFSFTSIILLIYGFYRLLKLLIFRLFMVRIVHAGLDPAYLKMQLDEKGIMEDCLDANKDKSHILTLLGAQFQLEKPIDPLAPSHLQDQPIKPDAPGEIIRYSGRLSDLLKKEYDALNTNSPIGTVREKELAFARRTQAFQAWFECIWSKCNEQEKFLLYDLAEDGMMNYRNQLDIYKLLLKELIFVDVKEERIRIISHSFRLYILSKRGTKAGQELLSKSRSMSAWGSMRHSLMVVIIATVVFLFLTQQEVSGKITALITALTGLVPLLLRFGTSSGNTAGKS